jgi:hypothetical protein
VTFKKGALVAVMGGTDGQAVRRICRVVLDLGGSKVLVETDSQVEGDAALEYDFSTPPPESLEVERSLLRPVIE